MTRITRFARPWALILLAILAPAIATAAPFAAYVMDARTGKPIYAQNADTKLHPASLTKMMTLYLAFAAIERGQVRLDSKFLISSNAAAEPPSKLGLRAGQRIELRYLIRAAAIKSANDAATAIGEGIAGSEDAFAAQMTATARALGMRNTNFRNANGLTQQGHYSTAQDMTILGRRLFYDFPQYYSLFSRRSADAGIAQVSSTNKRFLDEYPGADGIKTGYTRAAGFNLTASAQRGRKRIVASVFGGTSTAQRNQVMAQLLDAGFGKVPSNVREIRPEPPQLLAQKVVRKAQVEPTPAATEPRTLTLASSAPPQRTRRVVKVAPEPSAPVAVAAPGQIVNALREAATPTAAPASGGLTLASSARPRLRPAARGDAVDQAVRMAVAQDDEAAAAPVQTASLAAPVLAASSRPAPAPRSRDIASQPADSVQTASADAAPATTAGSDDLSLAISQAPKRRSETVILAAMGEGDIADPEAVEIVSRAPSGGRQWGVNLGLYRSQAEADNLLLQLALQGGAALEGGRRHVANTNRGFEATFQGLTRASAQLVCDRAAARQEPCTVVGP
ncbi:D-alanyl-D-alanine carboxypeptidase family protein [Paracoccus sp. M683]|uniref:D-alanyl-D-alanine carboxypeptidase family protein n=1 Tax=Paracoccus sp. M683 TaxID=2594268 RepID=UPI0021054224|nr:serine hydrolase [Paracoccus sp. M683]